MRTMNCRNIRREIEEAGSGNFLSAAALAHLGVCSACQTLSSQQTKLQALVAGLGTVEAPGDFDFRLRARLAAEKPGNARSLPTFSFGLRSAAVAALLLLIGSALVFVSFRPQTGNQLAEKNQAAPIPATPEQAPGQLAVVRTPTSNDAGQVEVNSPSPVRTPKERISRREIARLGGGKRIGTTLESGTGAPVIRPDDQLAEAYPTAAFPINASRQSLKVSVDDRRGASRTISLPAVSFGSERTLSQNALLLTGRQGAPGNW
jgi:hypothetical protein